MSRMPPSFSGGLLCAIAAVAATASTEAQNAGKNPFHESLPVERAALAAASISVAAIMPQAMQQRQAAAAACVHAFFR